MSTSKVRSMDETVRDDVKLMCASLSAYIAPLFRSNDNRLNQNIKMHYTN